MTDPVAVAVDANGADHGPAEVARGAAAATSEHDVRVLLFGPAAQIGEMPEGVEVIDAPVSIAKAEDPARAVRANPDASIVAAVSAVADGRADALVSGGSTGTALAASLFRIKRGRGIHRPALAVLVPVPGAPFLLLDAGANVEVRPEHLVQFAHMGAAFMEVVMGVRRHALQARRPAAAAGAARAARPDRPGGARQLRRARLRERDRGRRARGARRRARAHARAAGRGGSPAQRLSLIHI